MNTKGYFFVPCTWMKQLKKFVFGTGFDTDLKDFPDLIQPGDGFMSLFVDSNGHMEMVRLVYGDQKTGMRFDPEPTFLSRDMNDIIGYFREMSDEANTMISYGIQFNKEKESNKQ